MATWQPARILYPDAELVMCEKTRPLLDQSIFVGRIVPRKLAGVTAITWNRTGGEQDPPFDTASLECRIWAPTDQACIDLARQLMAVLPSLIDGDPITGMVVSGGPTDLGVENSPMRQILYDITMRGTQS